MSKMIRISEETDLILNNLQKTTGKTKQALLVQAVECLKKELFLRQLNDAYKSLMLNENTSEHLY